MGGTLACCSTVVCGLCSTGGREHPQIPMLPPMTIGYPVLQEGGPAGAAAPKPTQPHSPQRVPCYSGHFAPPHTLGLPPSRLWCLGGLFPQVGHLCGAPLCLLGPRSWMQSEQRGSAGSLGSGSNHSGWQSLRKGGPEQTAEGPGEQGHISATESQSSSFHQVFN